MESGSEVSMLGIDGQEEEVLFKNNKLKTLILEIKRCSAFGQQTKKLLIENCELVYL